MLATPGTYLLIIIIIDILIREITKKLIYTTNIHFQGQIQELKQNQAPSTSQLQSMLIDPAVNLLFEKMKTELTETKDRLEQAQNDLSAWKFTPDR